MDIRCYYCEGVIGPGSDKCPHCDRRFDEEFVAEMRRGFILQTELEELGQKEILPPELEERFLAASEEYFSQRAEKAYQKGLEAAAMDFLTLAPTSSFVLPIVEEEAAGGAEEELVEDELIEEGDDLVWEEEPAAKEGEREEESAGFSVGALIRGEEESSAEIADPTPRAAFEFSPAMLEVYGEDQAETLEEIFEMAPKMPRGQRRSLYGSLVRKITRKIDYPEEISPSEYSAFLKDFYRAHTDYLELPEEKKEEATEAWRSSDQDRKAIKKKRAEQRKARKKKKRERPPRRRQERRQRRGPSPQVEALKKVFMDNILWVVSAFLMISGAAYLVASSWSNLSGNLRLAVSSLSLFGFSGLLLAGSYMLRKYDLSTPSVVLNLIGFSLMPFSFLILSLFKTSPVLGLMVFGLESALLLLLLLPMLKVAKGHLADWNLSYSHCGVLLVGGLLHFPLPGLEANLLITTVYFVLIAYYFIAPKIYEKGLWSGAWVSFMTFGVWLANALFHVTKTAPQQEVWKYLGPFLVLLAFHFDLVADIYSKKSGSDDSDEEREEKGPSFLWVQNVGYSLALLGVFLSFGNNYLLLVSTALATILFGRDCVRYDLPQLLLPAYIAGMVAYFLSPLPIKHMVLQFRDSAAQALGYQGNKLPYAYYGLTFFPYLGVVVGLATYFLKKGKESFYQVSKYWAVIVSLGLLGLTHFTTSDMRAALMTVPLFMVGFYLVAYISRSKIFSSLGILCTLLLFIDVNLYLRGGWDGFLMAAIGLTAFYRILGEALAGQEDDPALSRQLIEVTSVFYWISCGLFLLVLHQKTANEVAGFLWGLGIISIYLGIRDKKKIFTQVGLGQILLSYPFYFYRTPMYAFSLSLGLVSVLALLYLVPILVAQFGSLKEKAREMGKEIREDFLSLHAPWTLIAAMALAFHHARMAGDITFLHLGSMGAIFVLSAFMLFFKRWALYSYLALISLGLTYLLDWYLVGFPPTGLPPEDLRGAVMAGSIYSFLVLLVAMVLRKWPLLSEENQAKLVWLPTLHFSRIVVAACVAMAFFLRYAEIFTQLNWGTPTSFAYPLAGVAFSSAGVFAIAYFSKARSGASLAVAASGALGILSLVDGATVGVSPCLFAGAVLTFAYLLMAIVNRRKKLVWRDDLWKADWWDGFAGLSAYFFVLGALAVLVKVFLAVSPATVLKSASLARDTIFTIDLFTLLLFTAYALVAFLWLSKYLFAFSTIFLSVSTFGLSFRHYTTPRLEVLMAACLILVGLFYGLGYMLRKRKGEGYLSWKGSVFFRAGEDVLLLFYIPNLLVAGFLAFSLVVWGRTGAFGDYLQVHSATMGAYLGALIALSAFVGAVGKRSSGVVMTTASLLIASCFYPLLSLGFDLSRPALEFSLAALLLLAYQHFMKSWRKGEDEDEKEKNILHTAEIGLALNAFAILFTGFHLSHLPLTLVLYSTALHLWLSGWRLKGENFLKGGYLACLLGHYALAVFLVPKTGKPAFHILPLFSVIALVHQLLGQYLLVPLQPWLKGKKFLQEEIKGAARSMAFIATLEIAVFVILAKAGSVTGVNFLLTMISFMAIIFFSYMDMEKKGTALTAYQFAGGLTLFYFFLVKKTVFLEPLQAYGPHGIFLLSLAFTQPSFFGKVTEEVKDTLENLSYLFPLAAIFFLPPDMGAKYFASVFLIGALYYGVLWQISESRGSLVVSAILLNMGLFSLWQAMGIVDPQFYGLPLGLTLIGFAQLTSEKMEEEHRVFLMALGFITIYGSAALQTFQVDSAGQALVLGLLSLAGIVIGRAWKNTTLVNFGVTFLVIDITSVLLRSNIPKGILSAIILILAGAAVFVVAVIFHDKKEEK